MAIASGSVASLPAPCCSSSTGLWKGTGGTSFASKSLNLCSAFCGVKKGLGGSSLTLKIKRSWTSFSSRSRSVSILAAKLPSGVEAPKEEPRLPISLWGFTEKAEVWNSRAAMIGIFALFALEFIAHKGILQLLGIEIGKGLDLPL